MRIWPVSLVASLALLASCTTAQEVRKRGGFTEHVLACGATAGWGVCSRRANEPCPGGHQTVEHMPVFNRKELVIP